MVLSPRRYVATKDLQSKLQSFLQIKHALYAQEPTVWTPTGSTREQHDVMEQVITVTIHYSLHLDTKPPVRTRKIGFADTSLPEFSQLRSRYS